MTVHRSLAWSYASQYIGFVLQFGLTIVMARLLTPHELGVFSVALSSTQILQALQGLSLSQYVVQQEHLDRDKLSSIWTLLLLSGILMSVGLALAAGPLAEFYREADLKDLFLLLALSNFIGLLSSVPNALMQREMMFGAVFVLNVIPMVAGAAVAVVCALEGLGPYSLAWMTFVQMTLRTALAFVLVPEARRLSIRFAGMRPMLAFSMSMSGVNIVMSVSNRLPELVFGRLLGMTAVGLYSRAASITEQAYQLIVQGSAPVLFADFARRRREGGDIVDAYLTAHACFTAVCWPAFAVFALTAEPLTMLLFGPNWKAAAPLIQILCLAKIVHSAVLLNYEVPLVYDRVKLLLRSEVLHTALGGALLIGMALYGDLTTAVLSRVGHAAIYFSVYLAVALSLLRFRVQSMLHIYMKSMAIALLCNLPAIVFRLRYEDDLFGAPLSALFLAYGLTALTWLVAVVLARHPIWIETRRFLLVLVRA